ncbi:MAG: hypothetical protein H0V13_02535 [Nocardioidaceae bacterium]|jgi:hypothetical protein|nr:hypothetical protein [Nocardioidaceae bacterium]
MYDVVLLIERNLTLLDAEQVTGLHHDIDDSVTYHVLLPMEELSGRLHTSMGSMLDPGGPGASAPVDPEMVQRVNEDARAQVEAGLARSVALLTSTGHEVHGTLVTDDPIDALTRHVTEVGAAEAIVLTEPHTVAEFFHLDWTSRARRQLDVPVLHLLEHETFEEQGRGGGEGSSGL